MRYLKSDKKYCWSDKGFPLYDLPYYVKIISVMIILNDGKPNKGMFRHSLNVWVVFIEAVYRKKPRYTRGRVTSWFYRRIN